MADVTHEESITEEFSLFKTATSTERAWMLQAHHTTIEVGVTDNATAPTAANVHYKIPPGLPPMLVKVKVGDRVWTRKFRGKGDAVSQRFVWMPEA